MIGSYDFPLEKSLVLMYYSLGGRVEGGVGVGVVRGVLYSCVKNEGYIFGWLVEPTRVYELTSLRALR